MCRDRLPASWPDLAEQFADFEVKCGLMDFLRGRQGLGSNWVDPYRCQDAFPGLVGPFRAAGGWFGAIFHIPRMSHIFPDYFSYFPYYPPVWARPTAPVFGHLDMLNRCAVN